MKIIFVILFFYSIPLFGVDCNIHKIYCDIIKLNNRINPGFAMKFSNAMFKYSRKYNMDYKISLAIAMQESSLNFRLKPKKMIVIFDNEENTVNNYKYAYGHYDIGIFQFNANTVQIYDINPILLLKDIDYQTEWHFKILKIKMKQCKKLKEIAWTCYHSKTPRLRNMYYNNVMKFYNEIK